jgi:hypothetical protein
MLIAASLPGVDDKHESKSLRVEIRKNIRNSRRNVDSTGTVELVLIIVAFGPCGALSMSCAELFCAFSE